MLSTQTVIKHFIVEECESEACLSPTVGFEDGDWETELNWSHEEASNSRHVKFRDTKTAQDFENYGPMAAVSYAVGLETGRQLDFEKALDYFEENESIELDDETWEEISRPLDPLDNCGLASAGPLDGTSTITLKLVS